MAEACYIPQYLPASFKGVPFEATEASSEHGRRGSEGEFPFSEETAYADMGRGIRRYTLSGRFIENNHLEQSEIFLAVCESPGPGILVHPTRGPVTAACTKLTIKDNILEESGITYVDLEFVEANDIVNGFSLGLTLFSLTLGPLSVALEDSFAARYGYDNIRYYDRNAVLGTATDGLSLIADAFKLAIHRQNDDGKWQALAQMKYFINEPVSLVKPNKAFRVINQSMQATYNTGHKRDKFDTFKSFANWAAKVSPLREEAGAAQDSIYSTFRVLSASYMARAAIEVESNKIDEALADYVAVLTILEQEVIIAKTLCDDNLYIELRKYTTQTQAAMLARVYKMPALVEYDLGHTVPSLVAAHEIFGNARRFKEIENRNFFAFPDAVGPVIVAKKAAK